MYKRKISDGLREVATAYDGIAQNLFNAARLLEENEEYNLEERAVNAVRIAESSTVELRNLAGRLIQRDVNTFYEEIARSVGVRVEEKNKWIEITVPSILPHRNSRDNQSFLTRPLRHALVQFQRENPIERFASCAICIIHQYDEALGIRRVRDYDNIETKRYLDVIESVLLTNDSGLLCSVLQTTQMGEKDATRFFLMQPGTLPQWAQQHIKTHTEIA